jgi:hypothetical protein
MKRLKKLPSPALIISIIALVLALAGTSVAAGLGILNAKAKNKTVGVGPLTYVTATAIIPPTGGAGTNVAAGCPPGIRVIGGGIRVSNTNVTFVQHSYPTVAGWAGNVFNGGALSHSATTTAICANSRVVTGAPPSS